MSEISNTVQQEPQSAGTAWRIDEPCGTLGIQALCQALLEGLLVVLGEKLAGVYVYGAVAFPDAAPTGDIDLHVLLDSALTDREKSSVQSLHASLAQAFPPLGGELDAYYLLLDDARRTTPPRHQLRADVVDESWALHREHIRAGRCIVLYGPDPKEVYPAASWPELEEALRGELRFVEDHLGDYPDYCILNLCRLMYSVETHEVVVSKATAATWAYKTFPEWRRAIDAARRSYARQATAQDKEYMTSEVADLFRFACDRIRESRGVTGNE
jgi:hypothetical protein